MRVGPKRTKGGQMRRFKVGLLSALVAAAMMLASGMPAGAASTEVPLTALYNNYGIASSPTANANFDGGGYGYLAEALRHGDPANGIPGLTAGQAVNAGGFTFTWPNRVNQADNVEARGQTVQVPAVPGATKLGLLAASVQGSASVPFILSYSTVDASGTPVQQSVTRAVGFTDWTRGIAGDAALAPNNTVVAKALVRHTNTGSLPLPTQPHVFLVTVPLDPTMTLHSVKLPLSSQVHIFAMALQ